MIDFEPLWLTGKLALITTTILLLVAIPIGYWLAYSKFRYKTIVEALISLPFVLPPSVLGFYLLLALSPENSFGRFLDNYFNLRLVFTTEGLIVASIIYSLPFMVNPLLSGFRSLPESLKEASYSLGKSSRTTLLKVLLPNMKTSVVTGIVMTFAHTIGEFGVVLMVGGSIPGETKVVSIAIFDEVQSMNYHNANVYSFILFSFTFLILLLVFRVNNKSKKTGMF